MVRYLFHYTKIKARFRGVLLKFIAALMNLEKLKKTNLYLPFRTTMDKCLLFLYLADLNLL